MSERVLIIDDEQHIRLFLKASLEAHGYEVHEARLGGEGLQACEACSPSLVILDLGLPDMEGMDIIRRLREWSTVPILVLSVRADEQDKVAALDAGANDYVTKPFGISELMARVRTLLRSYGQDAASRTPELGLGALTINLASREVRVDEHRLVLTRKEYQLLHLLATNAGRVLTHQHILGQLWGVNRLEDTHHLRVLIGQLRRKLGEDTANPRFIHTEQGVGYRLATSDDVSGPDS